MPWGAVIGAAATVVGGAMSADAAGDAADAQRASSDAAIAEQRRQFDVAQTNQKPFLETGTAANQRLAYLLGLNTNGAGTTAPNLEGIRNSLRSQFATESPGTFVSDDSNGYTAGRGPFIFQPGESTVDNAGLDSAAQAEYARQKQAFDAASANVNSADYGSLTRRFSTSDLNADPVYQSGLQFGLDEGRRGINQRAAQMGQYDSGATLKALTRFGNDYGSTKAEGAYNRYNADNTNIYNRLAGVSGGGQTAANSINSTGAQTANNISNLQTGSGNAQAAGIVGGANAWGGAIQNLNGIYNNYQQNQTLKSILGGGNSGNSGGGYSSQSGYINPYTYDQNYG